MDTRDSGVIDLFAIHKEEEQRAASVAPPALPSAPPPAVSFDTHYAGADADIDALAAAQQTSRLKAKVIGGVIGGLAVIGILIAAIASGDKIEPAKDTAAATQPPPAAVAVPAPTQDPTPAAAPAPAPTQEAAKTDAAYKRSDAIAAYNQAQGKGGRSKAKRAAKPSGPKLQKVQSSGTN